MNNYGRITCKIEQILKDRGISKNMLCKDLDIPRTNLNRYCRDDFQRIDANLLCKLCGYLEVNVSDILDYVPSPKQDDIAKRKEK